MSDIDPLDIAVVVVTHDSATTIEDCLLRVRAATGVHQIRVVDNDSRDGTMAIVQRHAACDPRLHFIANPDNPGFSTACNQGAADSDAGWLAFVNPDCLLDVDSLSRMRAFALPRQPVLLGADLVDASGVRDAAARRNAPDFGAMLTGWLPGRRSPPDREVDADDTRALQQVDAVSGALMLMRRELFDTIGGFDEGYRLHAEDLDLCRRAVAAGAFVGVANHVRVVHVRGVSSRKRPLFVEWHKHRGLWRYFRKFEAARRGLPIRVAVFCAIWLRFPLAALRAAFNMWRDRVA